MKILITGDKGFVGTETKKYIEAHSDIEVIGYDIMDGYDIRDAQQLEAFVQAVKPDRILHLAAIARFAEADADPYLAFETNVLGTRNVALIAGKHHIPVVYSSTGSVYMPISDMPPETGIHEKMAGKGNSVYGCTKYMGEEYIREYCNPYIILRYAHLYGKEKRHHGLIGGFMDRINRGLAPTLYGGNQSNDFTYITDVARFNFIALTAPWDAQNQAYNVGTGEELTAKEAGDIVCKFAGYKGEIKTVPAREVDPGRFFYDMTKSKVMLGFEPEFTFEKGLNDMFKPQTEGVNR
jgi:nucleoside-diphosphate-sugar epimerase